MDTTALRTPGANDAPTDVGTLSGAIRRLAALRAELRPLHQAA